MISKYVISILDTLNEINFNWISNEIENAINEGKTIEEELYEPPSIQKFTENEELKICLNAIKTYFIDTPGLIDASEKNLNEILISEDKKTFKLLFIDAENQPLDLFIDEYKEQSIHLSKLLKKALQELDENDKNEGA